MQISVKPIHKYFVKRYKKKLIRQLKSDCRGRLLDIGCGDKPFKPFIEGIVDEYIGLEHPDSPNNISQADIFGSADDLPFSENSFDTVLLIQVLEHVEEPGIVLSEIQRVLKPGGKLIIAVPFIYPEHESPRDFYRYTRYGLFYLTSKVGLDALSLYPVAGFGVTYIYMLSHYLYNKHLLAYLFFLPIIIVLLPLAVLFEKIDRNENSINRWTWNFIGVFEK